MKTPAKPKSTAKPASRKTRKKVVVMEVEVTDDEDTEQAEKSQPAEKKVRFLKLFWWMFFLGSFFNLG